MNKNDPFKYHSLESIKREESPIVYIITEEMVQDFAEANYGRLLTEEEASSLFEGFCEDEHDHLYNFMDSAVEYVLGEEQARQLWSKSHNNEAYRSAMKAAFGPRTSDLPLVVTNWDVIQTYAIATFGRSLTDEELQRVVKSLKEAASLSLHMLLTRHMESGKEGNG